MQNYSQSLMEALAAFVTAQPGFKPAAPCFVSIYNRSQHYGGPEEGGWWYDRIILAGSLPFQTREAAELWLAVAKAEVQRMNRAAAPARARAHAALPDPDLVPCPAGTGEGFIPNDWSDGGELWITIEETAGQSDNSAEPRPHYE